MSGKSVNGKLVDVSNYYLTDGCLMHLDKVTNMMATVIPSKSAQEKLVEMFHLAARKDCFLKSEEFYFGSPDLLKEHNCEELNIILIRILYNRPIIL